MLRARILTAVIVLCLFLAALFYLSAVFWMVLLACPDRGGCMGMEQAGAIFPELLHLLPFIHHISGWRAAVRIGRRGFGQSLYDSARTGLCRLVRFGFCMFHYS